MSFLCPDVDLERELGSRSLREFVEMAWHQVEPVNKFIPNWHIDAICDHLEAVTKREIKRLVINVPPGTMKSLATSVFWPAWMWTHSPEIKWITASYALAISKRDARRARELMETEWYKARWGDKWAPNKDDWSSTRYSNNMAGFRMATTIAGAATGEHGDHQLVDDPIKPLDASGAKPDGAALKDVIHWWDETMTSRMVNVATTTRTIIMQRLHDRDLSGHVLGSGDYTHLNLPMEYEPRCVIVMPHACSLKENARGDPTPPTPIGFKDERKEGELLFPARFPASAMPVRKREMGSRGYAAQDQQRPMPSGGGIFKRDDVKFWTSFPKGHGPTQIQSWDCTFKGLDDSDFVVGQTWVQFGADYYLIDQVRDQMNVSATCRAIITLSAKWPRAIRKLVEDKANGSAVMQLLEKKVPGLIPVNPQGGKISRAHSVEPLWEAGNIYIPDPTKVPDKLWVHDFVEEVVNFNGDEGRPDDQVDAMTQALVYLHGKTVDSYKKALRTIG